MSASTKGFLIGVGIVAVWCLLVLYIVWRSGGFGVAS